MAIKWKKKFALLLAAICACFVLPSAKNASADGGEKTPVLVLMYHQLLRSRKSDYIVSPELFEKDLILLKEKGYCCVTSREIIDYVLEDGDLPEKPVLITFDDGHYNTLHYGAKILKEQGFTALISVIGKFCNNSTNLGTGGNANYSYLTWNEIRLMADSGLFEIGNHTYDMHEFHPRFGAKQMAGESDADYTRALKSDVEKLQNILKEKCGVECNVFAYPFGEYNALTKKILSEEGFDMMLTCNEGVSVVERGKAESLFQIRRYNRSPSLDLEKLLQKP